MPLVSVFADPDLATVIVPFVGSLRPFHPLASCSRPIRSMLCGLTKLAAEMAHEVTCAVSGDLECDQPSTVHSLKDDWKTATMRKIDAIVLLGQALSSTDATSVAFRELGYPQAIGHELETFLFMLKKEMSSPNTSNDQISALTTSLIELVTRRGEGVYSPDQYLFNRRVVWDSFMFDAVGGKNGPILLHSRTSSALTLNKGESAGRVVTYRGSSSRLATLLDLIDAAYSGPSPDPASSARVVIASLYVAALPATRDISHVSCGYAYPLNFRKPSFVRDLITRNAGVDGSMLYLIERDQVRRRVTNISTQFVSYPLFLMSSHRHPSRRRAQSFTRRTWRLRAQTPEGEVEVLTATSNLMGSYGVFDAEGGRVAAMQSNWTGTKYRCFEVGEDGKEAEVASIEYSSSVFSRKPRRMRVVIDKAPLPSSSPRASGPPLRHSFDSPLEEDSNLVPLTNRQPWWNGQIGAYVLNFEGRVTLPSVKNFQLVRGASEELVMQFGRIGRDGFQMDAKTPLTTLQAFLISLTTLDKRRPGLLGLK